MSKTNRGRVLSPINSIQHVVFTKFLTPKCPAHILVSQKSKVLPLQSELKVIDDLITSVDVTVTEDKIHGSMVAIAIKAASDISHDQIRDKVSDILARYTVKYRLEIV